MRAGAAFVLIAAVAGCNAIAGIDEPRDPGGSSSTSGTSGTPVDPSAYVGSWVGEGSETNSQCSNASYQFSNEPQSYAFQVSRSESGALVVANSSFRNADNTAVCTASLSVNGAVATMSQPTTCLSVTNTGEGVRATYTSVAWNLASNVLDVRANLYFATSTATCSYAGQFQMKRSTAGGGGT